MDKAITAKDYAERDGQKTTRERIRALAKQWHFVLDEKVQTGKPVKARMDFGRWIADCECGGAEAVDPSDAVFFCISCGNEITKGRLRPVQFPENYKAIEKEIMARPVVRKGMGDKINQQVRAKPKGDPRSWSPE